MLVIYFKKINANQFCLGCAVPLSLKAEIMEVLAAFAISSDIAYTLWNSIEVAQILATASPLSANAKGIVLPKRHLTSL